MLINIYRKRETDDTYELVLEGGNNPSNLGHWLATFIDDYNVTIKIEVLDEGDDWLATKRNAAL